MNFKPLIISALLLTVTGLTWAAPDNTAHNPQHGGQDSATATNATPMGGCGMSSMMAMHGDMNMHEYMRQLHDQMTDIQNATDPARREELMQQHMDSIDSMMRMMQNMQGHAMNETQQGATMGGQMHHMMSHGAMMNHGAAPTVNM